MMPLLGGRLLPMVSSVMLLGSAALLESSHRQLAAAPTVSAAPTAVADTKALTGYIRQWESPFTVAENGRLPPVIRGGTETMHQEQGRALLHLGVLGRVIARAQTVHGMAPELPPRCLVVAHHTDRFGPRC